MSPVEPLTREEYLAVDAAAPEGKRWEYHDGGILALVGASPKHSDLVHTISRVLGNRLQDSKCRVRQSRQRVRAGAVNGSERREASPLGQVPLGCEDYLYPDVVAFCYEGEYTDEWPPSLLNPQFVAEVVGAGNDRAGSQLEARGL